MSSVLSPAAGQRRQGRGTGWSQPPGRRQRMGGSVVEFSPATREARVRFPAHAVPCPLLVALPQFTPPTAQCLLCSALALLLHSGQLSQSPGAPLPPAAQQCASALRLSHTLGPKAHRAPAPTSSGLYPNTSPGQPPFSLHHPDETLATRFTSQRTTVQHASSHLTTLPGHAPKMTPSLLDHYQGSRTAGSILGKATHYAPLPCPGHHRARENESHVSTVTLAHSSTTQW